MKHKLIILTSDPTLKDWGLYKTYLRKIQNTLNKTKNATWEVETRYRPLAPKVVNTYIDHAWFNSQSFPLFREGYHHVAMHFTMKQWDSWGIKGSLRGGRLRDDNYVGEMYFRADEDTKRGNSGLSQFVQTLLHEVWHELCHSTGVADDLHTWHSAGVDITKADWSRFDMNDWQPQYQEVQRLQTWVDKLALAVKKLLATKPTPYEKAEGKLQPLVERQAVKVLEHMEKIGQPVRIVEGYRSLERQQELYNQGRLNSGKIVTNAKPGQSMHQYGIAVDYVFRKEGYNASDSQWQLLGAVGKLHGFDWGGDWTGFIDKPHMEMSLGHTWREFQANTVDWTKWR